MLLSLERDVSIADQNLETQTPDVSETIADAANLQHDKEAVEEALPRQREVGESAAVTSVTGPFQPGDKVMAYKPHFYGGKPKPNPWTPAIVESMYSNDQYISYVRPQDGNGNKAVEYAFKGDMHHANPEQLERHATEFAILEQRLPQSLRAQLDAANKTQAVATLESTQTAARHEPENGAISVTDKQSRTERRTQIAKTEAGNAETQAKRVDAPVSAPDQLREATNLTAQLLGDGAKAKPAQPEAGAYRGPIIGETSELLLQRLSPRSVVAHNKDLFEQAPIVGANIAINYSEGKPAVRQIKERGRALELSR